MEPLVGRTTCVPGGCGAKRSCPKTGSIKSIENVSPAHAVPAAPTPLGETWKTPGSAPAGKQAENAPICPHDGIRLIPGSPTGQGKASPALQTVPVLSGSLLLFSS